MSGDTRRRRLGRQDLAEIVIGSLVLAFPVAVTEEVWNLSEALSPARTVGIVLCSLLFITVFVHTTYRHGVDFHSRRELVLRVATVYVLTLLLSAATLFVIDKLPIVEEPGVALTRTIIVAFPASFAATVVDSLGD